MWERYKDLYPESDLVYIVGVNDYHTDWFFAHVTRYELTVSFLLILDPFFKHFLF